MPPLSHPPHETFACMVAAGKSKTEAAKDLGLGGRQPSHYAHKLSKQPKVAARILELQVATSDLVISRTVDLAIANRERRIAWLEDRSERMRVVVEERSADPGLAKVPGGTTGLLVKSYKQVGTGHKAKIVAEFSVDTDLLREMRATEEQAAKELGQWSEKRELTGDDGGPLQITISAIEAEY